MIRPEQISDIEAIRRVHRAAFPTDLEAQLVDELRNAGKLTISLVAEIEGQVVGHVALSPVTIDNLQVGLGLAPVAVLPQRQRSGIGSALIRQALGACRSEGIRLAVVLGEPAYYSRFGFVAASHFGLQDTYGGGEAFQAIIFSLESELPTGTVHYAPEFALLG